MVFNKCWGFLICGLVCSTSSGFSSGLLWSVGVFGLRFPFYVCLCGLVYLLFVQLRRNILTNMKECTESKPVLRVSLFIR